MNDPLASDPWPDSDSSPTRAGIRLLMLVVILVVLPMLLLGASLGGSGCGGG